MLQPTLSGVPLLGALCVAAGLVTQDDVESCLVLQQTTYPGTPIGQILVLRGYLSQADLARIVAQQQSFRRIFCATLDERFGQVDAQPHATTAQSEALSSTLPEMGAFTASEVDASPLFGVTLYPPERPAS